MKSLRFNLSAWVRPVRVLLAAFVCALVLFSQAMPAYSSPKSSSPTSGEANLLKIEKEAQEAVLEDPYSLDKTQKKANEGLNEIQGSADLDKMKRPENSQGTQSIEQKVQKALEKVTGEND